MKPALLYILLRLARPAAPFSCLFLCGRCCCPLLFCAQVPDFNDMYELYDPCTVMFFFRNKHIMIDLGTGNNNKISWAFNNKQEVRVASSVLCVARSAQSPRNACKQR